MFNLYICTIQVVDKTPPTCNVTQTTGTCSFGADVCLCSNYTWGMSVSVGDVGEGLLSVFPSDAGNNSKFTLDKFNLGHKISNGVISANLR